MAGAENEGDHDGMEAENLIKTTGSLFMVMVYFPLPRSNRNLLKIRVSVCDSELFSDHQICSFTLDLEISPSKIHWPEYNELGTHGY